MNSTLVDAYAVLLPAHDGFDVPGWLESALRAGLVSVLIGETRDEYVARVMTDERRSREHADDFTTFTTRLRETAARPVIVAVDQEPWGVRRLHDLVPALPGDLSDVDSFGRVSQQVAIAARAMGVTMFLAPVLDRLTGTNAWLDGRTLDESPEGIAALGEAFVRATQAGGVAAVVKHFPGFPAVTADPALHPAVVPSGDWDETQLLPFRRAVAAGVTAVMTGPAPVQDVDADTPASTSAKTTRLLREDLGFDGLIISDDLDAPATAQHRSVPQTAVDALTAGVELLLLAGGEQVAEVAEALASAADADPGVRTRLARAAHHVRAVAQQLHDS